jgi:hypothetical protein
LDLSAILQLFSLIPVFAVAISPIPILVAKVAGSPAFTTFDFRAFGVDDCFTRQASDYFTNELRHFGFYFLTMATSFCSFLQCEGRITALQKICWKYCLHPKFDHLVNCFKV